MGFPEMPALASCEPSKYKKPTLFEWVSVFVIAQEQTQALVSIRA